jgi:hypothetical protein
MRMSLLLFALLIPSAYAAEVCGENDLHGAYGLQLSGVSKIAESAKPAVSLARIVFETEGSLSGYSSVNFDGLLLGNPVTGTYQAGSDCNISWSMQDDSGAWQHFSGKMTSGGTKAEIRQTDPGAGVRGLMERTPESCSAADFKGRYDFTLATPQSVSIEGIEGMVDADGNGKLDGKAAGVFEIDSDCIVHIDLAMENPIKLRGVLVNGGKEILAIRIDPGGAATARFTARAAVR